MKQTAFITGATSGIGRAIAIKLSEAGYRTIITGRRKEQLEEVANQIKAKGGEVLPLSFDVREKDIVFSTIRELPQEWNKIDLLINNAGLAVGLNTIQEGVIDDWERMIDTNIKGLLYITKAIAPLMIKYKKGHIINIASTAGKEVYPNGNVYCATKHAVDALSRAMRIDMLKDNIKVTNIAPGMVETEFSLVRFKGDEQAADKVYDGLEPLSNNDIADIVLFIVSRPAHVCINDIVITPTAQANSRDVVRK